MVDFGPCAWHSLIIFILFAIIVVETYFIVKLNHEKNDARNIACPPCPVCHNMSEAETESEGEYLGEAESEF